MNLRKLISLFACLLVLTSCSFFKKEKSDVVLSAEEMYAKGLKDMEKGRNQSAVEQFSDLERTYPYSPLATKAEIMSAYTNYKHEKYDDALSALDRFVKLHPGNEDAPYAYYLKALCFYDQISDVTRDQSYTQYAKTSLEEVISRFPDSQYAQDAKLKLDLVVDHLAGKEVEIGRFYLKQHYYISAINRLKIVLEKYNTTSHTPEALHRMVEAYMSMGLRQEAIKYAAVLGYNYPGNKWYKRSYELIEGKKYREESEEEKAGKWYDFKNITDIYKKKFEAKKAVNEEKKTIAPDSSGFDRSVVEDSLDGKEKKKGVFKKMKSWIGGIKIPFIGAH